MDSSLPTTPTTQAPGSVADPTESERLHRNLTPAIAEIGDTRGFFRYAVAALVALAVALCAIFMFNAIVDPLSLIGWRIVPPAVEADRSIKLDLIDRLKKNPQVVVLGSSRSRQAEPKFIQGLTGLKNGFNAGVTGGDSTDAWVMVQNIAARFPHARRAYIWFVDYKLASNGINPQLAEDPHSRPYLGGQSVRFSLADVGTYLGFQATDASYRVVKACMEGRCGAKNVLYNADGSLKGAALRLLPEDAPSLTKDVAEKMAAVKFQSPTLPRFKNSQLSYFEKSLAYMNAHGATPVIVLNPIYPSVYQLLQKRHSQRDAEALAELQKLQKQYHFVVVDGSNIHDWGGKAKWFNNATHINRLNMRLLLTYVVAHSDGALKKP
jgi:hypothetical protein